MPFLVKKVNKMWGFDKELENLPSSLQQADVEASKIF
jgi:hypothetical protein